MASIEFMCAHCRETLEATDDMAGQTVECPSCGTELTIPQARAGGAPAAGPGKACPKCKAPMDADALLCVQCGYHTKLGRVIETNLS
jgi:DNA-directed RNA polymerase subunit RPC12/RpoP